MTKLVLPLIAILLLSACEVPKQPTIIVEKPVVFIPSDRLFNCPVVDSFPNPDTLTDEDVAELLVTLDSYNHTCKNSLIAVRKQLLAAKAKLEAPVPANE